MMETMESERDSKAHEAVRWKRYFQINAIQINMD